MEAILNQIEIGTSKKMYLEEQDGELGFYVLLFVIPTI